MGDTDDMHLMKPRAHSNLGQDQSKDPLEEKKGLTRAPHPVHKSKR